MKIFFVNDLVIFTSILLFIGMMFVINKDIEMEEERYENMLRRRI